MTNKEFKKLKDGASYTTATELKAEDERIEVYNNGWNDCKAEIVKLIMEDYRKDCHLCNYFNDLLNKIDKI